MEDQFFIEPPHRHNLLAIPSSLSVPVSKTGQSSEPCQVLGHLLQGSLSVAFTSFQRLQRLLGELQAPRQDVIKDLEGPAAFNLANRIRAELGYLREEAMPDLRHKAARFAGQARREPFSEGDDFQDWWRHFQFVTGLWKEQAEKASIPIFTSPQTTSEGFYLTGSSI